MIYRKFEFAFRNLEDFGCNLDIISKLAPVSEANFEHLEKCIIRK